MTAAARICAYIAEHGTATRPELQRALDLHEKAVESAIRKLLRFSMIESTGARRREGGPRLSPVYRIGSRPFNQADFSRWIGTRPRRSTQQPTTDQTDAFAALNSALFGMASPA